MYSNQFQSIYKVSPHWFFMIHTHKHAMNMMSIPDYYYLFIEYHRFLLLPAAVGVVVAFSISMMNIRKMLIISSTNRSNPFYVWLYLEKAPLITTLISCGKVFTKIQSIYAIYTYTHKHTRIVIVNSIL